MYQSSSWSTSSLTFGIISLVNFSIFRGIVVLSHCGSHLCEYIFICLVCVSFFVKCLFKPSAHFKIMLLFVADFESIFLMQFFDMCVCVCMIFSQSFDEQKFKVLMKSNFPFFPSYVSVLCLYACALGVVLAMYVTFC